jgi:hypothetical protein
MKCTVGMGSDDMLYIQSFSKNGTEVYETLMFCLSRTHVPDIKTNNSNSGYSSHIMNGPFMQEYNRPNEGHKSSEKGKTSKHIRKVMCVCIHIKQAKKGYI